MEKRKWQKNRNQKFHILKVYKGKNMATVDHYCIFIDVEVVPEE